MCAERSAYASPHLSRRSLVLGGGASLGAACLLRAPALFASSRPFPGGRASLRLPWPITSVDPHELGDPGAMLLGAALFDTLYTREPDGRLVPSLAESMPVKEDGRLTIPIRSQLRTAFDRPIDARDVLSSLHRLGARDGAPWLAPLGRIERRGTRAIVVSSGDADDVSRRLASPLTSIVPLAYSPRSPDGTGAFRAEPVSGALRLTRNSRAALGPSWLEEVMVRQSPDLVSSLRAFESRQDDVGWLGRGLHEPRRDARKFDFGSVGWAVLRAGRGMSSSGKRGSVQRICDSIPFDKLAHLRPGDRWRNTAAVTLPQATRIYVRADAPWLIELARAVANALVPRAGASAVVTLGATELAERRAREDFPLMIDVLRPFEASSEGILLALDPSATVSRSSGRAGVSTTAPPAAPRLLARRVSLGVLADVRVEGGAHQRLMLARGAGGGLDLACTYWQPAHR